MAIRPHNEANFLYVFYYLRAIHDKIRNLGSGTTFTSITGKQLKNIEIMIPPLSRQHLVVAKIESIFSEIDSAMRHAANDANRADALNREIDGLKLSILDKTFRYEHYQDYGDTAQQTTKVVKLSDIAEINPKKPLRGSVSTTTNVTFVPMRCIEAETGKIDTHITKPYHEVSKGYHYFQNNDILFAKITPCMENGKIALANNLTNNMGFATTEVYVIRLKNDHLLSKFYLWYLMQPKLRQRARQTMSGSAGQLRMPLAFLSSVLVPVPPLKEQRATAARIESIFSKIDFLVFRHLAFNAFR